MATAATEFGQWAELAQLGDGRAILLGELETPAGANGNTTQRRWQSAPAPAWAWPGGFAQSV
jgi:hypothetical protein